MSESGQTVFLSFGAGVQSSVMLMLALRGEIERPDHVIWADTGFEPRSVYRHVDWAERQCLEAGLPFHRVKAKRTLREDFAEFERGERSSWRGQPPLHQIGRGQVWRHCTVEAKIVPLEQAEKRLSGHKSTRTMRDGECIVQIGISTDEARRAAPSQARWYERSYPLIDPMKMSRSDCQAWWDRNFPSVHLPSSSCTICPYKTAAMWARMKKTAQDDFAEACEYDERIRAAYQKRTGQTFFLSSKCVPLSEIADGSHQGNLDLEDAIYCAGGCGL